MTSTSSPSSTPTTSSSDSSSRLQIYPSACHAASPTLHTWVKLTSADVHRLRREPGFEGQNLWFFLNHPIRYVYLCGVVTSIEFRNGVLCVMSLDDGSGVGMELVLRRVLPRAAPRIAVSAFQRERPENTAGEEDDSSSNDGTEPDVEMNTVSVNVAPRCTSTTTEKLTWHTKAHVNTLRLHDIYEIDIGTVLKAKGVIETYRSNLQLSLLRAEYIASTIEEMRVWRGYAAFVRQVLSKPWILSEEKVKELQENDRSRIRKEAEERSKHAKMQEERQRKKKARVYEWEERMGQHLDRIENRRLKEEKYFNGNALDRI